MRPCDLQSLEYVNSIICLSFHLKILEELSSKQIFRKRKAVGNDI